MSYYNPFRSTSRSDRAEHEKAWQRAKATAWDATWQKLSPASRLAYLTQIKSPAKASSANQPTTLVENVNARALSELVKAGLIQIEPARGGRKAKLAPIPATHDFSTRIRTIHHSNLLGPSSRESLTKFVKYAFLYEAEGIIDQVLTKAKIDSDGDDDDNSSLEQNLEHYVVTGRWPEWALRAIKTKQAGPLLKALELATGPVRVVDLPGLIPKASSKEIVVALDDLIRHLVVFEDLKPDTLELVVGLLPAVRERLEELSRPQVRPPLVVCEKPREFNLPGGLAVNDLRIFLLELTVESTRLRQDGAIFQKDEPRFLQALPDYPNSIEEFFKTSKEQRLDQAFRLAQSCKFVEKNRDETASKLLLSGKGQNWLTLGIEEQNRKIFEHYRVASKTVEFHHQFRIHGDALFFGVSLSVIKSKSNPNSRYYGYYQDVKPEQVEETRGSVRQAFESLPIGVYHRLDSVLNHLSFGNFNPLIQGGEPSKLAIFLNERQVPTVPELLEKAGRQFLDQFLRLRLLPLNGFGMAFDEAGQPCVARLPRFQGYFGRPYESTKDKHSDSTRVIVQPDFSVVVIGLDPAPAAELAPFCDRASGHVGQGVLTFKITRDSVIRAVANGLSASAILSRLKKRASVAIPENILQEIQEWAGWVRLVNVRPLLVVNCPDSQTVSRVVSALGKKAEKLGETKVALHLLKMTSLERQRLQEHGILITKDDITVTKVVVEASSTRIKATTKPTTSTTSSIPVVAKKRGRPKKVR